MGTSNFARGNTSRVFAVLMNEDVYVCSECEAYHYEENPECCEGATFKEESRAVESYDVDDFKYYVREVADNNRPFGIRYNKEDGSDLFSYRMNKMYGDIEVEVQIVAKMVSGYYEGASLDYVTAISHDDFYYSDMSDGMKVIQQRNAERWADKAKDQLIELVEQVFEHVSMPLKVVATFSNGETIYEKL